MTSSDTWPRPRWWTLGHTQMWMRSSLLTAMTVDKTPARAPSRRYESAYRLPPPLNRRRRNWRFGSVPTLCPCAQGQQRKGIQNDVDAAHQHTLTGSTKEPWEIQQRAPDQFQPSIERVTNKQRQGRRGRSRH